MKTFLAWVARFRWVAWIVLAAVIAIGVLLIRRLFAGTNDRQKFQMPAVPPEVQRQVEKAEERALVARVEAHTLAEAKKQELVEIVKIPDGPMPDGQDGGKERRKRLAALLQNLN